MLKGIIPDFFCSFSPEKKRLESTLSSSEIEPQKTNLGQTSVSLKKLKEATTQGNCNEINRLLQLQDICNEFLNNPYEVLLLTPASIEAASLILCNFLIQHNLNDQDKLQEFFIIACKQNLSHFLSLLLKNSDLSDFITKEGIIYLFVSAENGHLSIVKELLRNHIIHKKINKMSPSLFQSKIANISIASTHRKVILALLEAYEIYNIPLVFFIQKNKKPVIEVETFLNNPAQYLFDFKPKIQQLAFELLQTEFEKNAYITLSDPCSPLRKITANSTLSALEELPSNETYEELPEYLKTFSTDLKDLVEDSNNIEMFFNREKDVKNIVLDTNLLNRFVSFFNNVNKLLDSKPIVTLEPSEILAVRMAMGLISYFPYIPPERMDVLEKVLKTYLITAFEKANFNKKKLLEALFFLNPANAFSYFLNPKNEEYEEYTNLRLLFLLSIIRSPSLRADLNNALTSHPPLSKEEMVFVIIPHLTNIGGAWIKNTWYALYTEPASAPSYQEDVLTTKKILFSEQALNLTGVGAAKTNLTYTGSPRNESSRESTFRNSPQNTRMKVL